MLRPDSMNFADKAEVSKMNDVFLFDTLGRLGVGGQSERGEKERKKREVGLENLRRSTR
jgi:hypothetical protein